MGSSSTDNNVRAAPQSQPYKRSSSHSNQHSPRVNPKKDKHKNERHSSSTASDIDDNSSGGGGSGSSKLTLSSLISLPWVICQFFFRWTLSVFFLDRLFEKINTNGDANDENNNEEDEEDEDEDEQEPISIPPSPALTTLLDHALYRSYQAELVPTVCAATQLLQEFIEMKEAAALIWRECRWMVGVPLSPGLEVGCEGTESMEDVALGYGISVGGNSNVKVYIGGGVVLDERGNGILDGSARSIGSGLEEGSGGDVCVSISGGKTACPEFENMAALEETKWSEFETIQDFAQQCYQSANEAIHRLTTDRLSDSANLTLQDSILSAGGIHNMGDGGLDGSGNPNDDVTNQTQAQSASSLGSSTSLPTTPADIGIGRCYNAQPRRDCWESPRLYCPDYAWADDAIGGCQRLLRSLSKHRFVSLVGLHGWNRYANFTSDIPSKDPLDSSNLIPPPEYASSTPHPFPSLEVIHALNYLVSQLLPISIPSSLNQFRAAVEANTVISKRLYLVKCEYRAPLRAHMEGWLAYKAAPKIELVERYLREFHGVNSKSNGEKEGHNDTGATKSKGNITLQKKPSSDGSKKPLQLQRELLEKQISENYWKHPAFVEALQLERCCERLEAEMSQMLMPFANVAREIMDQRKGRLRAVAVFVNQRDLEKSDDDDEGKIEDEEDSDEEEDVVVSEVLGWRDVPYMKELLRVSCQHMFLFY